MATLRSAVKALLAADGTLMATLTGGMYDRRGISRTATPAAYDAQGKMKPCGVVTLSSEASATPPGLAEYQTETDYLIIYLYEQEGNHYAAIDVARDRIKTLLDRQTVAISSGKVLEIRYADGIGDAFDEVLNAEMSTVRFYAWRHRA
jgi:hypothetical protein